MNWINSLKNRRIRGDIKRVKSQVDRENEGRRRDTQRGRDLGRERDADLLTRNVELDVVLAHEHVAEDPQRAVGSRDVDALHGKKALATVLDDVLAEREGVAHAAEGEGEEEGGAG